MRDLTARQFCSNSPMKNYLKLQERIELLEKKLRAQEQVLLELVGRRNV